LDRLLPALGKAAGLRLEADRLAAKQVVVVSVKGVDRPQLLDQIAAVTHAQWTPITGGYKLVYEAPRLKALWQREAERQESWLRPALAHLVAHLERERDFTEQIAAKVVDRGNELVASDKPLTPSMRTGIRLASALGPSMLASVKPGERVVLVQNPNRFQRALPASVPPLVSLAVAELRLSYEQLRKRPSVQGVDEVVDQLSRPVKRVFVVLSRAIDSDSVGVRLVGGDEDRMPIVSPRLLIKAPVQRLGADDASAATVALPLAAEFQERVDDFHSSPPSPGLKEILLHPENNDPLGLALGPTLERIAQAKELNLVACLPDCAFSEATRRFWKAVPAEKAIGVFPSLGLEVSFSGRAMLVEPTRVAPAIVGRSDRGGLGALGRSIFELEAVSFEAMADYADHRPYLVRIRGMEKDWLTALTPGYAGQAEDMSASAELIRVFRDLPLGQIETMQTRDLLFAELDPRLQARIVAFLIQAAIATDEDDFRLPPLGSIDITDIASQGAHPDLTLQMGLSTEYLLGYSPLSDAAAGQGGFGQMTLTELVKQHWTPSGVSSSFASQYRFRPYRHRELRLSFGVQREPDLNGRPFSLTFQSVLEDSAPVPGTKPATFDQLPSWFLERAWNRYRNPPPLSQPRQGLP
jgi:hypothetical protein